MPKGSACTCLPAALIFIAFLSGCGAMRNDAGAMASSDLVGQWRRVSIATTNGTANCPATLSLPGGVTTSCGENDVIEFHANGTFTATFSGSPVRGTGTWRLKGNSLVLTFVAPPAAAGSTHSTTVVFVNGGRNIDIETTLVGTPATETYTRL